MVYNHTGFKRAVDWFSDLFTPAEPQKLLRFTKDVETTMVMKNGGGQNDKTTGTSGGETNVDKVTDASPSFKPSTKGKGIVEIVGDVIGGYQAGAGAGEAVMEEMSSISIGEFRTVKPLGERGSAHKGGVERYNVRDTVVSDKDKKVIKDQMKRDSLIQVNKKNK